MKKFLKIFIFFFFLVAIVYGSYMSIFRIEGDRVLLIQDLKNKIIVDVRTKGISFVPVAIAPWRYSEIRYSLKKSENYNVKIIIPTLLGLENRKYLISFDLLMQYNILNSDAFLGAKLSDINSFDKKIILPILKGYFFSKLSKYITPNYRYYLLMQKKDEIFTEIEIELAPILKKFDIKLIKLNFVGDKYFPEYRLFLDGKVQLSKLVNIENKNQQSLYRLKNKIEEEALITKNFYKRLKGISSIISKNPDILKYIYIDKLAGNVKVILSNNGAEIPVSLGKERENSAKQKKKRKIEEIDNLR